MSRSFKKHPVGGTSTASSDKVDKTIARRKWRNARKQRLRESIKNERLDDIYPLLKEVSNVCNFRKDGKTSWWNKPKSEWEKEWKRKMMRK